MSDEAQQRHDALQANTRAEEQCRDLAADLRRARDAWHAVARLVPKDEAGQDRPHALDVGDVEATFEDVRDRLTYLIGDLEDRAECFDRAAVRVAEAIGRAYGPRT